MPLPGLGGMPVLYRRRKRSYRGSSKKHRACGYMLKEVLNSPALLREAWATLKTQIDSPAEVARIDELLNRECTLLAFVAGDTVSTVVTGHLLSRFPSGGLAGNSKSDYPDLFLKACDYSELPARTKKTNEFGAAVRGKQRKPIRVPDGLEIKTSRNNATIDCHYPHVGLHLMLSFLTTGERVVVDDVLAAFLRYDDYRITTPKTKATTLKATFSANSIRVTLCIAASKGIIGGFSHFFPLPSSIIPAQITIGRGSLAHSPLTLLIPILLSWFKIHNYVRPVRRLHPVSLPNAG